jgi:hypothetical protein
MKSGTTQFSNLQLYIGIDVHKKQWSVSIFTDAAHHRTFSQPPSPVALKNLCRSQFSRGLGVMRIRSIEARILDLPGTYTIRISMHGGECGRYTQVQ